MTFLPVFGEAPVPTLVSIICNPLAVVTVAAASTLGPWLVRLLYGGAFAVGHAECFVVSIGIGLFLVATVVNDLTVARGMHRNSGWYWAGGAAVALIAVGVLPSGDPRTFGPIIAGSVAALLLTLLLPRPMAYGPRPGRHRAGRPTGLRRSRTSPAGR